MEVSPLSRGMMLSRLNPCPSDCRAAFAFSILLYPQFHGLPCGKLSPIGWENYGLTTFRASARVG